MPDECYLIHWSAVHHKLTTIGEVSSCGEHWMKKEEKKRKIWAEIFEWK